MVRDIQSLLYPVTGSGRHDSGPGRYPLRGASRRRGEGGTERGKRPRETSRHRSLCAIASSFGIRAFMCCCWLPLLAASADWSEPTEKATKWRGEQKSRTDSSVVVIVIQFGVVILSSLVIPSGRVGVNRKRWNLPVEKGVF